MTLISRQHLQRYSSLGGTLLLLLVACSTVWGQKDSTIWLYKGKLQNQFSISMEINIKGNICSGRYYYDKYRSDVLFEGKIIGNKIKLKELPPSKKNEAGTFVGTIFDDGSRIVGNWETSNKNYSFELNRLHPIGAQQKPIAYEAMQQFQELLNFFDLKPEVPFTLRSPLSSYKFKWIKGLDKKSYQDYLQIIPYRLARKYIMQQVPFSREGGYNYFKIPQNQYQPQEFCYRSVCRLVETNRYIGLLFYLNNDTGWDNYDVCFLLVYDHSGQLIDGCKIAKDLQIDEENRTIREKMTAIIQKDYTLITNSEKEVSVLFVKKDLPSYSTEKTTQKLVYKLMEDGRFEKKDLSPKEKN